MLCRRIGNLSLDTFSTINLPPSRKMTSRALTEGKFLVPPDLRPPSPKLKKKELPPRPRSKSKSAQATQPTKSPKSELSKRVKFARSKKAGESIKSGRSKRSTKEKKPKLRKQPEQPKSQQQHQHQHQYEPKPPPAFQPHPFRRETILQLRQNPPSLSAAPTKVATTNTQIALPKIKPKKVKRRMATIYDVIARMNPVLYCWNIRSNISRSCRSSWIP